MSFDKIKSVVIKMLLLAMCFTLLTPKMVSQAVIDHKPVIMQSIQIQGNICLFVKGLDQYNNVTGQIGREAVKVIDKGSDFPCHTIIMIDNSLSITKDNLVKVKDILKQYIDKKNENEKISLATYGADIQFLTEKETDKTKLTEVLNGINNEDKETYLTDVLYDEIQQLADKDEYTRFIVVTDGVDNKALGYTKEELQDALKKDSFPIYTIGCRNKNNEEQLKNLFAISRLTNADYYLLNDDQESSKIVTGLADVITSMEMEIPEEMKDGAKRDVLLSFESGGNIIEISGEVAMPFGVRKEETVTETAEATNNEDIPIVTDNSTETETAVQEQESTQKPGVTGSIDFVSIGAIVIVIIAVVVLIIVNINKKKKVKKEKIEIQTELEDKTILSQNVVDENATVFLEDGEQTEYIIVLRDDNDKNKVFRYPLSGKVVVGRKYSEGVNLVLNYEPTVSAKHCEISYRGGSFYIKDLHSSNGTFVNGQRVVDSMEFAPNSNLKLGNLSMTIEVESLNNK